MTDSDHDLTGASGQGGGRLFDRYYERVRKIVHLLPEQYREIIVLRNYVEYSWEEVAKEHGRPSARQASTRTEGAVAFNFAYLQPGCSGEQPGSAMGYSTIG